mmetsp:Transcript_71820/g.181210  ORF Transcript_71820/g.181210 Transcript_71820/m.181210 type:complete len:267 (-) Transcript_71820:215-1015(-)
MSSRPRLPRRRLPQGATPLRPQRSRPKLSGWRKNATRSAPGSTSCAGSWRPCARKPSKRERRKRGKPRRSRSPLPRQPPRQRSGGAWPSGLDSRPYCWCCGGQWCRGGHRARARWERRICHRRRQGSRHSPCRAWQRSSSRRWGKTQPSMASAMFPRPQQSRPPPAAAAVVTCHRSAPQSQQGQHRGLRSLLHARHRHRHHPEAAPSPSLRWRRSFLSQHHTTSTPTTPESGPWPDGLQQRSSSWRRTRSSSSGSKRPWTRPASGR